MIQHYSDYYWKNGKPYGKEAVSKDSPLSYKIVPDPYYRRFSIEKYKQGHFDAIIYDSFLFDFRHLKFIENLAWDKEYVEENQETVKCLLRDPDDRAVVLETHHFEQQRCRYSLIYSIHGLLIAINHMYYTALQDPFNGVVLYDIENRPIMMKTYDIDEETKEFSTLLTEEWNMQMPSILLKEMNTKGQIPS